LVDGKEKTHDIYRALLREHATVGTTTGHIAGAFLTEMARRPAGSEGSFTEPQCMHALADLFGAGVDTTLATLRWVILYLAVNPEFQERLQTELDSVVSAKSGHSPELGDAPLCPFTEAAIAETLRIRPVVPTGIPHGALKVHE
jgi:ecdysteroid 25-hydroxylase CYP306A1